MDGFINVLKPPGMSSGTVVAIVKRVTGEKAGLSVNRTITPEVVRSGGSANELWMPLDDYVRDQGGKLRAGLEEWLRLCGK